MKFSFDSFEKNTEIDLLIGIGVESVAATSHCMVLMKDKEKEKGENVLITGANDGNVKLCGR